MLLLACLARRVDHECDAERTLRLPCSWLGMPQSGLVDRDGLNGPVHVGVDGFGSKIGGAPGRNGGRRVQEEVRGVGGSLCVV